MLEQAETKAKRSHTGPGGLVWITWENQVRNESMSRVLNARLFVITDHGNRLARYLRCGWRTVAVLKQEQPAVVFAQNPSIVLILLLLVLRPLFGFTLVSDAHYVGVRSVRSRAYQRLLDTCNQMVDLVVVTNAEHKQHVEAIGGKAVICEDPLPEIEAYRVRREPDSVPRVLFICSFDTDEPLAVAFAAARRLFPDGFRMLVTGNYRKGGIDPRDFPELTFLGYLPKADYYAELFYCAVVLDLTNYEGCLVCGAYEAMAAGKPLVTSDTAALRAFFTQGTIFTRHDEREIAEAIKTAYRRRDELEKAIAVWKAEIQQHQQARKLSILRKLGVDEAEEVFAPSRQ
ncbi:glycosyltransferase family protein [Geomesophilobacter sediminis]|uniref:Glycosyltransferase n=1 Tax=Geomesophilobacter sediminis TaxID=2798584 RepID=A0A8J7S8H9_9BACT|nr:glycosyltransferase [Geomesophilobacter sediminis]MBJ6727567.1 glycosyltransferase [Geomesophilobacter sediminis]